MWLATHRIAHLADEHVVTGRNIDRPIGIAVTRSNRGSAAQFLERRAAASITRKECWQVAYGLARIELDDFHFVGLRALVCYLVSVSFGERCWDIEREVLESQRPSRAGRN